MTRTAAMFVSIDKPQIKNRELSGWECDDCSQQTIITSKLETPFCSHCGSDKLKRLEAKEVAGDDTQEDWQKTSTELAETSNKELVGTKCSNADCNVYVMFNLKTAKIFDEACTENAKAGQINCPVCSKPFGFETSGLFGRDEGNKKIEKEEEKVETKDDGTNTESKKELLKEKILDKMVENESENETKDGDGSEEVVETKGDGGEKEVVVEKQEEVAALDVGGVAKLPLVHYAQGCVNFVRKDNKLFAMMVDDDGNHVCVGAKEVGGDTHQLEQALVGACGQGAEKVGEILAANGFGLSCVNVAFDKMVMNEIDKRDAVIQGEYREKMEQMGNIVEQSLSIASAGIHRGFFGGSNPLASSLARRMASAGVDERTALEMISVAMDEAGDDYAKVLRDKTMDIANKSEDVRNELANTVMQLRGGLGIQPNVMASNGKSVKPSDLIGGLKLASSKLEEKADTQENDLVVRLKDPMGTAPETASSQGVLGGKSGTNGRKATKVARLLSESNNTNSLFTYGQV